MLPNNSHKFVLNDFTPRYYQMYISLRDRIRSGEFAESGMIPVERELCEEYGISRTTVVKALEILEREGLIERQQGRGTFIKKNLEDSQKDISPNLSVGLVCGFIDRLPVRDILVGISKVLANKGIPLLVFGYADSSYAEELAIRKAIDMGVNGIIVCPRGDYVNGTLFQDVLNRGIPVVMTDRYYPDLQVDYVIYDDWQGGFDLTTRLIEKGHKKIAFAIADEILPTSVHGRLAGYKAALEKYGLPYDENLVWLNVIALVHPEKKEKLQPVLEKEFYVNLFAERPTGIVAVNYDVAKFLLETIYEKSSDTEPHANYIRTIEVSSFDHHPAPTREPHILSLAMQPGEPMGVAAAEIMVKKLLKKDLISTSQIKLPMGIVDMKTLES